MALPYRLEAFGASSVSSVGFLERCARVVAFYNFLKIRIRVFLFAVNFSDLESRCFDFIGARRRKYTLDFESYPILAEHISQCVADLADSTLRPDRSQNVINQISISRSRTPKS